MNKSDNLTNFLWLSIGAAIVTIGLKTAAYLLTGSVGLLADAVESIVNLVAAAGAMFWLKLALRPPDAEHAYGHGKAEYFSAGIEGGLVIVAAVGIAWTAIERLLQPVPFDLPPIGVAASVLATVINATVSTLLLRAAKRSGSLTLEADGRHLLADVWTSVAVLVGLGFAWLTGLDWLDPVIGAAVAVHVAFSGVMLVYRATHGLLDRSIETAELEQVKTALAGLADQQCEYHALRTRQAGTRRFVSFHLLVPDNWTVERAHTLAESLENDIRARLPQTSVFTHIEPRSNPTSFLDTRLDR